MPRRARGLRDGAESTNGDAVAGRTDGSELRLEFLKEVNSPFDYPRNRDMRSAAERALFRGDRAEVHSVVEVGRGMRRPAGRVLWIPSVGRAAVVMWEVDEDVAEWTSADGPLDALRRWAAGRMAE